MPYKRITNEIYTKNSGTWRLKQTCKSVESAKRALRLLQGLEKGTIKRSEVRKAPRRLRPGQRF